MKWKSNRLLSILLTMVMLLSILPTTAFAADTTEDTVITFAHATVDVPVAGAKPDFDLEVPEQSHYTVKVEAWKCDDDGSTLTRDDVFEKGKSYTVYIEFSAEEGWKISSGGNCKVNGDYAPGYDNSNEFKRRLSFDVINELIPSVNVTGVKTPVAGELPDVSGIVTDTKGITFDTIKWLGHYSGGPISGDGKFKAGDVYDLEIKFTTDKYYALADDATVTTDFACENKVLGIKEKVIVLTYTIPDPDKLYMLSIIQGSSAEFYYKAGEKVTIVAATPSEGEKFDHWAGGEYLDYTEGSVNTPTATFIMPARNVFLDAEYVDAAITYTVSFNAGGGTGTMADKTGISGEYTLPENGFTAPDGKQFKAWSVGGVEKAAHEKITVTADTTVTALWEDIPVAPKTLDSIAITTPPTKTAYIAGESFDSTGMVVTATYSDSSTAPVTGYTVAPDGVLGISNTEITVTYTEDGVVKTATQAITVTSADSSGVPGDSDPGDSGSDDTSTVTPPKPSAPEYVNPFTDVSEGDYFYDAVKWAIQNDITTGISNSEFAPDMVCTRAQAVTFLYRAAGSPDAKGEMPFSDVAENAYYHDAVLWAIEKGITKGISETEFAPDAVCTREQIVTFLYRAAISLGKDVSVGEDTNILSYDDAFDIGEWAIPAVQWACGAGVMNGTSESTLSPQMECTRGQIVTFLYRTFR